ncbi:MAG: hypothetical protein M3Q71_07425 [Chloroflexota bacterium]|nr:hypothetical protein [Chloroflexota bacterium]MDP9470483.1 hypothetical protein [Chloroflexota bacterium]
MNTAQTRRIVQTTAEDLHRLAAQGEKKGVRILVDSRTGQHVATSASDPTRCYHLDAEQGCTCKGYGTWGRCQHFALFLSELGRLPEVGPAVTEVVVIEQPAPCRTCRGEGFVRAYVGGGLSDWIPVPCGCQELAPVA